MQSLKRILQNSTHFQELSPLPFCVHFLFREFEIRNVSVFGKTQVC